MTGLSNTSKDKAGILTFAFGTEYQLQAYCQALTARKNLNMELTAVVEDGKAVDKRLERVANIVALKGTWDKFEYEQLALDLTPYDLTYKTDADLVFPRGSTLYHATHLPVTSGVACDVRGTVSDSTVYREVEADLGAPTIYSACFSFNKHMGKAQEFFETTKDLYRNWYRLSLWEKTEKPLPPTTDTVYSIAWMKVMGLARINGNEFVHAKPKINGWDDPQWTKTNVFMMDDGCRMYVDGIRLCKPFHYFDKTLITPEFIKRLEDVCAVRKEEPVPDRRQPEAKPGLRLSRLQASHSAGRRRA